MGSLFINVQQSVLTHEGREGHIYPSYFLQMLCTSPLEGLTSHLSKIQLWLPKLFVWYSSLYCASTTVEFKTHKPLLLRLQPSDESTLACRVGQVNSMPSLLLLKHGEVCFYLQEMPFWRRIEWNRIGSVGWGLKWSSNPTARPFQG